MASSSSLSSAFTTGYQPTPLEQAYTFYLLDVVLQVPREPFRLSGRLAVPFLNSSGVDRNVLRQMWTVVDPSMEGSLLEVIQFSSLLKMVSLAQQKWLDLAQYEGQLLYRQVPLPTFLNLVVPTHNLLLELYPAVTANRVLLTAPLQKLSVSDAFDDLIVDAPLPALPTVDVVGEDFGHRQEVQKSEGHDEDVDEFGDFVGDSAIPIESISEPRQTVSHSALLQETPVDDEDFGDFSGIPTMASTYDTPVVTHDGSVTLAPTDPASSTTNYIHAAQNGPLPSIDATGAVDDFGDFVGTSVETTFTEIDASPFNNTPAALNELSQFQTPPAPVGSDGITLTDPLSSAFDEIQPIHNQPLPPLTDAQPDDSFGEFNAGTTEITADVPDNSQFLSALGGIQFVPHQSQDSTTQDDNDDFGSFEGVVHALNADADALSSAFDEIQPMEDQPLPALHSLPSPRQVDDSDDFGDFEGVPNVMIEHDNIDFHIPPVDGSDLKADRSLPPTTHAVATNDDFGDFEGIPESTQGVASSVDDPFSSAFDSIQPIHDQPLPPLNNGSSVFRNEDDDFGSFEGVNGDLNDKASNVDTTPGAVGVIPPIQNQPVDDEDFGDFSGIPVMGSTHDDSVTLAPTDPAASTTNYIHSAQEDPLPSLDVTGAVDDFGDFVGTSVETTFTEMDASPFNNTPVALNEFSQFQTPPAPVGSDEITLTDPLSSAFDEIQPIHNQPLPPLTDAPPDDSFGEFNAGTTEMAAVVPGDSQFSSAFGGIQSVPYQAQDSTTQDDNDDFGSFEGGVHVLSADADPLSSAFDEIQPMEDQPLPALHSLPSPRQVDDSDDFGDFEGVPNVMIEHDNIEFHTHAVDGSEVKADRSLSPMIHAVATNDGFGDFEGIPESTQGVASTVDDPFSGAFDSIQPIHDQPLPPLNNGSSVYRNEDDDFGSFEGVNGDLNGKTSNFDATAKAIPSLHYAPRQTESEQDNNEFEIFGGVTNLKNSSATTIDSPFSSAFDDIQPIQDQPLKPLESWSTPVQTDDANGDEFGNFSCAVIVTNATTTAAQNQVLGAYGHMLPIQDHPLPSLDLVGTIRVGDDDDDFGDFVGTSDVTPSDSLPNAFGVAQLNPGQRLSCRDHNQSIIGQVSMNEDEASAFGDFEGVKESPIDSAATCNEGIANLMVTIPDTTQKSVDVNVLKDVPENQVESTEDDADWGDFEHVQVPIDTRVPPVDDFADFNEAPQGEENGLATSTVPFEFAAFNSVLEPNKNLVFGADFGDVESDDNPRETKAADNDFGDWDSFQDTNPRAITCHEPPRSLDEIQVWLQGRRLTGLLTNINVAVLMKKNLVSKNWTAGFGTKSSSTLQRARRCYALVTLLSSSCSNLLSSAWSRVVTVARNELTMGLFLLQEATGLSKEAKKEVKVPLGNMVSGLGEFVRVVRSIIASVGDIFCLDLQAPLSKEVFASSWQALDIVQLAMEVEESWKSIEHVSRTLGLFIATRLETIQAIRTQAADVESSSLCQLTLQPLSHVESTKNEVIWEGKPFMACSANFWSNRVSNTFP